MSFVGFYFTVGFVWALFHTGYQLNKHNGTSPDAGWEAVLILLMWPLVVVVILLDLKDGNRDYWE